MKKNTFIGLTLPLLFIEPALAAGNAVDIEGKAITINTRSLHQEQSSGKIYGLDGRVYVLTGTYKSFDKFGNTIYKKCSEAKLFTDPTVVPDVPPGSLVGPECKIQQVEGPILDSDEQPSANAKKKVTTPDRDLAIASCKRFAGYAPPMVWSPQTSIMGHIGSTSFKIDIKTLGSTLVHSLVRFWGPSERWQEKQFNGSTSIRTGDAAASVYMRYKGVPLGSAVEGKIC
ncbi:hypothetical protein H0A36_25205 [Endozoicomonas sp. SM1973]|uniref:Uncharacterized protein n=1 Tax=Spartinivicinus marinus TaxID=2994442 RepID=A0A853IBU8_9GAMM|nr:hypothetical protein [Spartinivicinus marinus]MCX4027788.1 hypothetical protein [Spartinivicinus marinus]NYZ69322.1 hypothetical protein [Spartinivicinus marinus]